MIVTWAKSAGGAGVILGLNPAAWYRLGQGITVTGSGVSQWNDQSGNARHLLQAVDTNRPALQADGTILFDGVDNFLEAIFALNQPETIYIAFKQVTWTLSDKVFDGHNLNSGLLFQTTATPELSLFAGAAVAPNTNLPINTYGYATAIFNGAASLLKINETAPTTGDPGAANMGGFCLGAEGGGTGFYGNVQVKEVAVFAAAHDATQQAAVRAYFARL